MKLKHFLLKWFLMAVNTVIFLALLYLIYYSYKTIFKL